MKRNRATLLRLQKPAKSLMNFILMAAAMVEEDQEARAPAAVSCRVVHGIRPSRFMSTRIGNILFCSMKHACNMWKPVTRMYEFMYFDEFKEANKYFKEANKYVAQNMSTECMKH
jgi:hypothetical protein